MFALRLSRPIRFFLLLPYFLLIIAGLMVPSDGGHGIFSIKGLAFLSAVTVVFLYLLCNQKFNFTQYKVFCFLLCAMAFLLTWLFISLSYEETPVATAWDQFKLFWITISVIAISVYVVSEGLLSFRTFFKTILYANCAYSTLKIGLVVLHVFGIVNLWSVVNTLGIRFMSMGILSNLPRMQTSIDIATPFLIFFFLQRNRFDVTVSRYFSYYFLIVSFMAIFLSFSRFLIFVGVLSVFLHCFTLSFDRILRAIPIFIISCVIGIYLIGFDNVYAMVEKRLFSNENYSSDRDRIEQIEDLMGEHAKYSVLGKGLGGYVPNNIRDKEIMHSYEVQWAAFLMQFGVIGISFLLVAIGIIVLKILSRPWTREKIALFILFLAWLFSGFTNPFLVSLTSGILYSLFLLSSNENIKIIK